MISHPHVGFRQDCFVVHPRRFLEDVFAAAFEAVEGDDDLDDGGSGGGDVFDGFDDLAAGGDDVFDEDDLVAGFEFAFDGFAGAVVFLALRTMKKGRREARLAAAARATAPSSGPAMRWVPGGSRLAIWAPMASSTSGWVSKRYLSK